MLTCPHRPPCGGCPLLDLDDAEVLQRKRARVVAAFDRFGWDSELVAPCRPAPSRKGYRTRVKLAVAEAGGGRVRIGLFRPGTHEVVDTPDCLVIEPGLVPVLATLRARGGGIKLRHVDLRWSRAEQAAHVTLVTDGQERPFAALARRLHEHHPFVRGASLRRTGGKVPRALAGKSRLLGGEPGLEEKVSGRRFHLSPGAFFQVDPDAAEILHEIVRDWLVDPAAEGEGHLLDLYAGVGAFGIALNDSFARVTAVENVETAAEDARRSAALSGVRLEVVHADAAEIAGRDDLLGADRIVVDPPRRGLDLRLLQALGRASAGRIAYVACDPETAARDADVLRAFDLVLRGVVPVDSFANTASVESVLLLERAPGAFEPDLLHRQDDLVVALKPAALPTHPQAEGGANLRDVVRRATGLEDLQPVHRLDLGTSGPVLFARGDELARLGEAFASGAVEKEYVALVRGVPRRKGRIRIPAARGESGEEESRYLREDVVGGYGFVRVLPRTGRYHQIRRHMASIGHPLLGDTRHGEHRANRFMAEAAGLTRLFLHLTRLAFDGPDGRRVTIDSPLPPELRLVLHRLIRLRAARTDADPDLEG